MFQVRRSLVYWARGNKENINLLAFLLMLKQASGHRSTIRDCSINKLTVITGCSWATCRKYAAALTEQGFLTYNKEEGSLTIRRISSGTKHRNLRVDGLDFRKLKSAKDSVRHLIHILGIAAKRFVKEVIRAANKPMVWPSTGMKDDRKKALALCKKFVRQNPGDGRYEYQEWGKSFATIAKEMGCGVRTAVRIVRDGVRSRYYIRHRHQRWFRLRAGIEKYCEGMFTFITRKGFACKVEANTYDLGKEWKDRLCADFRGKVQRPLLEEEYEEYMARKKEQQRRFKERYKRGISWLSEQYKDYGITEHELYSMHTSLNNLNAMCIEKASQSHSPATVALATY